VVPWDVCGQIVLHNPLFSQLHQSHNLSTQALLHNHKLFIDTQKGYPQDICKTLFDCAAIYVATQQASFLEISEHDVWIDEKGNSFLLPTFGAKVDHGGVLRKAQVALKWRDLPKFLSLLVTRLS
jgi:hypothetical protein